MEDLDVNRLAIALEGITKNIPDAKFMCTTSDSTWLVAYSPEAPMSEDIASMLVRATNAMSGFFEGDILYSDQLDWEYGIKNVRKAKFVGVGIYEITLIDENYNGIEYVVVWR